MIVQEVLFEGTIPNTYIPHMRFVAVSWGVDIRMFIFKEECTLLDERILLRSEVARYLILAGQRDMCDYM